ncbi:acid-sensing ion channel 1B-like [Hydractinia symbiolongicarpus]|uniref:acid-sensing ion channel 1B-like n=1 Tax=Hydractinia symbiolongicarpus TaxID=13093 RepID=UPI00254FC736|nr:acid-sensing ion channel 1B-like [Hydractinia symbiolongicarpus]
MLKFEDLAKVTVDYIHETKDSNEINGNGKANKRFSLLAREKTPKELRRAEIRDHVNDMISNSSFHGVSYIFDKKFPVRRTLWFLVTLAAFCYSIEKVYESTVEFLQYPFNTAYMKKYVDELDFPAVSFCNRNDMKLSVLNGTTLDKAILFGEELLDTVSDKEYENITTSSQHDIKDMLLECNFNGVECSPSNFTTFKWKQGDKCYTFNSALSSSEVLRVTGPGVKKGLSFTVNIQHYDYYRDGREGGIHLILHGSQETPVKMTGQMISPGYTSYIQVEKKKILNLKAPYKTNCGSLPLKYFKVYSKHTCWLEQLTNHVEKICHCKDFFMPGNIPVCNATVLNSCVWGEWANFTRDRLDECPLPCEIDSYSYTTSRSLFPSNLRAMHFSRILKNLSHMQGVPNVDTKQFIRDNILRIVVYYDDLSFALLEQKPSYDMFEFLGDIGGQVGLFVGAGVMSYFELIDCFCLVIHTYFFFDKKKKTEKDKV